MISAWYPVPAGFIGVCIGIVLAAMLEAGRHNWDDMGL